MHRSEAIRRSSVFRACVGALVLVVAGCATRRVVTTREHVTTTESPTTTKPVATDHTVERSSSTTVVEHRAPPRGLIGELVHVVGQVVALPFRLIGGLIQLIF